jgi:hypothetical protein
MFLDVPITIEPAAAAAEAAERSDTCVVTVGTPPSRKV